MCVCEEEGSFSFAFRESRRRRRRRRRLFVGVEALCYKLNKVGGVLQLGELFLSWSLESLLGEILVVESL